MGKKFLWAFLFLPFAAVAAEPPPTVTYPDTPRTYVPGGAQSSPAVQRQAQQAGVAQPTNIGQIPTPDTVPAPGGATGIIAPSTTVNQAPVNGQYRNAQGQVNLSKMFLDRYRQSVVRVTARDLAGNELSRAMGVGVGRNAQFIATPLSIVLGNSQQWADKIEITHSAGNRYFAKVALIDEEKNIVLLAPEANPSPLPYAREQDERSLVDVFFISFEDADGVIAPAIHRGRIAATNGESGLLSLSSAELKNETASSTYSGTALINSQGELLGMLLPEGRGVLASTLQKLTLKAEKATPIEPNLVGAILGRGVLVQAKTEGAYPTISAAFEAIKKGEAPKTDTSRYTPARNRTVAPREADRVVVKVMPGTYREAKPLSIPSNISLSGSGPGQTTVIGADPEKPVFLLQDVENTMIAGFRIVPAALQKLKAPTVIISKGRNISLLGNVVEAKGGVAVWAHESQGVKIFGNAFARGQARGLSCDRSTLDLEGNAFLGDWPMAVSVDKGCNLNARRNLFSENKTAITISSAAGRVNIERNSFIRTTGAVKFSSAPRTFFLNDNLFFECNYALLSSSALDAKKLGRNAVWRSKMEARNRNIPAVDLVRTEPKFVAPASYDFRLSAGQSQFATAEIEPGAELGAFSRSAFVGTYTQQLVRALGVAIGEPDLAETWGLQ